MLPEDSRQKLKQYLALLRKWQCSINLVSPATLDHAWERHFEDSLQLAPLIPEEAVLFDLGCGAGFPGLVLAIARPDIKVTLIESDTKKCTFLSTVSRETMTPVSIVNQRIESAVTDSIPTIITARALASLDKLLGYVMPWAKANPDLVLLFLKGRQAADEVTDALLLYDFTYEMVPSRTDSEAQIVRISNLREKSDG